MRDCGELISPAKTTFFLRSRPRVTFREEKGQLFSQAGTYHGVKIMRLQAEFSKLFPLWNMGVHLASLKLAGALVQYTFT